MEKDISDHLRTLRGPLQNRRILVIGCAGFIPSHLCDRLLALQNKVIGLDSLFMRSRANLRSAYKSIDFKLFVDDATDRAIVEKILLENSIEVVINCATMPLNYSFINPASAFDTNTRLAVSLLELLRARSYETLVQFSSSEVYGTATYTPMDELHPIVPTTPYAAGKASADLLLASYVKTFGLDALIFRPFNNYGPRQNAKGEMAALIPATIKRLMKGYKPLIRGGGEQTRDYLFCMDTVGAIVDSFEFAPSGEALNISSGESWSVRQIVEKICSILEYSGDIEIEEGRAADVTCQQGTCDRLKSLSTFRATPLDQGLLETTRWYENNPSYLGL